MLYLILALWLFGAFCMLLDTLRIAYTLSKDIALAMPIFKAIVRHELASEDKKASDSCIEHFQSRIFSTRSWFIRVLPCSTAMLRIWPLTLLSLILGQQIYESKVRSVLVASAFLEIVDTLRTLPKEKAQTLICQVATLVEITTRVSLLESIEAIAGPQGATEPEDA